MKLATFREAGVTRIGVVEGEGREIVDLAQAAPDLPREMIAFLEAGPPARERAAQAAESGHDRRADLRLLHAIG